MRLFDRSMIRTCAFGASAALPLVICCLSFSGSVFAGPTSGPATEEVESPAGHVESIRQWFADLANSDASVREDAMVNLMGLRRQDLPLLRKVVEDNLPLAPSQAAVLPRIVTQVYLAGDVYQASPQSGFLGIRMARTSVSLHDFNPESGAAHPLSGVVVEERMPGFCAGRMLRDGDVIIGIVEKPQLLMDTTGSFAIAIQDVSPGQVIHFAVLRHGQVRHMPIALDPRPVEANQGLGMSDLLERRHRESEAYWNREFAPLIKEGVS